MLLLLALETVRQHNRVDRCWDGRRCSKCGSSVRLGTDGSTCDLVMVLLPAKAHLCMASFALDG